MNADVIRKIDDWFAQHDGDGEFERSSHHAAPLAVGEIVAACHVVYMPKAKVFATPIGGSMTTRNDVVVIGQRGLPNAYDLSSILDHISDRQLLFLGDMDPVDLLTFAWLRASLGANVVKYLGIHDRLLASLGIIIRESIVCDCSPSELASWDLLNHVLPNAKDELGPECYRTLQNGMKVEIEALVSYTGKPSSVLLAALA